MPHLNGQRTAPPCLRCWPGGLADDKAVHRHRMFSEPDRVEAKTQLPRDPEAHAVEQPPDVRHRDAPRLARVRHHPVTQHQKAAKHLQSRVASDEIHVRLLGSGLERGSSRAMTGRLRYGDGYRPSRHSARDSPGQPARAVRRRESRVRVQAAAMTGEGAPATNSGRSSLALASCWYWTCSTVALGNTPRTSYQVMPGPVPSSPRSLPPSGDLIVTGPRPRRLDPTQGAEVSQPTFACGLPKQVVVRGCSLIRVVPGRAARAQVPQ